MTPIRVSGLGLPSHLLGLRRWRSRDLAQRLPECGIVAIGTMLARRLNELLSLALAFVGWLGLRHGASKGDGSVGDLRPRREARSAN